MKTEFEDKSGNRIQFVDSNTGPPPVQMILMSLSGSTFTFGIPKTVVASLIRHFQQRLEISPAELIAIPIPLIGSRWKHYNTNVYRVTDVTNLKSDRQWKYPVMISYQNVETGEKWSRKLVDWHRSMTELF